MLDCWYNHVLFQPGVNSKERLYAILEDKNIELHALAQEMKSQQSQEQKESQECERRRQGLNIRGAMKDSEEPINDSGKLD